MLQSVSPSRPNFQNGPFCFAVLLLSSIISPHLAIADGNDPESKLNISSVEKIMTMSKARPINPLTPHIQPPNSPSRVGDFWETASLQGSYGASPIGDYQRQNINDYGRQPPSSIYSPSASSLPPVYTTATTSAATSTTAAYSEQSTSTTGQPSYHQAPSVLFSASIAKLAAPPWSKRPQPPLAPPTVRLNDASDGEHHNPNSHAYLSAQPPAFRPQPPNILPHAAFGALSIVKAGREAKALRDVVPSHGTESGVQQPPPMRVDAHRYYYPPRMPLPMPQCFHNPTGYPCCNPTLNDLMVETYSDLEASPRFHSCNINAIATMLQARAEKKFNTTFETIAAFDDFAQKIHFLGDLVCKVELGGKYMLAYGTVRDAAQYIPHEEEDAFVSPTGSAAGYGAGRKKRSSAQFEDAQVLPGQKNEANHSFQTHTMWI